MMVKKFYEALPIEQSDGSVVTKHGLFAKKSDLKCRAKGGAQRFKAII